MERNAQITTDSVMRDSSRYLCRCFHPHGFLRPEQSAPTMSKVIWGVDFRNKTTPRTDADRLREMDTPKTLAEAVRRINEARGPALQGGELSCIDLAKQGAPTWPPEDMVPKEGA